jgi:hypothetical protein
MAQAAMDMCVKCPGDVIYRRQAHRQSASIATEDLSPGTNFDAAFHCPVKNL